MECITHFFDQLFGMLSNTLPTLIDWVVTHFGK